MMRPLAGAIKAANGRLTTLKQTPRGPSPVNRPPSLQPSCFSELVVHRRPQLVVSVIRSPVYSI